MKNVFMLAAVALMLVPINVHSKDDQTLEKVDPNCHTYACQVAEQYAEAGSDVNVGYSMAYDYCTGGG